MTDDNQFSPNLPAVYRANLPPSLQAWLQVPPHPDVRDTVPAGVATDTIAAAIASIRASLHPPTDRQIAEHLQWLRMVTTSRESTPIDLGMAAAAYADALKHIPADIWHDEVREYGRMHKWWPALAELSEPMEAAYSARMSALRRLQWLQAQPPSKPVDPAAGPRGEETRLRELAEIYERHGNAAKVAAIQAQIAMIAKKGRAA